MCVIQTEQQLNGWRKVGQCRSGYASDSSVTSCCPLIYIQTMCLLRGGYTKHQEVLVERMQPHHAVHTVSLHSRFLHAGLTLQIFTNHKKAYSLLIMSDLEKMVLHVVVNVVKLSRQYIYFFLIQPSIGITRKDEVESRSEQSRHLHGTIWHTQEY